MRSCHLQGHCPMKRRQLLFRVPVQHLLICIFVSPCFPNWEHVLRALQTFISFGVSFSSFFVPLTTFLVFGVSFDWIKNLTEVSTSYFQFSSATKTSPAREPCCFDGRTNFLVSFNSLHVIFSSEALKCLACWVWYKDTMRANQLFSCFPPVDFRDAGTTSCVLKNGRQELIRHKREFLSEKSFNGTWNDLWATWWEARSWINLV